MYVYMYIYLHIEKLKNIKNSEAFEGTKACQKSEDTHRRLQRDSPLKRGHSKSLINSDFKILSTLKILVPD